jgi:hypothetical protein
MAKTDQFKAQEVIDALKTTKGMITLAAKQLNCAPNTVRRYIREYPSVAQAAKDYHEQTGDELELVLYNEAISKRNPALIMFMARTKYKDRGYTEKLEIDVRYVALIKQMETAAQGAGIDLADALNDFYAELSATSISTDAGADSA